MCLQNAFVFRLNWNRNHYIINFISQSLRLLAVTHALLFLWFLTRNTSYKWNTQYFPFLITHFTPCSLFDLPRVVANASISFSRQHSVPLNVRVMFSLATDLLMDVGCFFTLAVWIIPLGTWVHKELFGTLYSTLFNIHLEVKLLDSVVILCLLVCFSRIAARLSSVTLSFNIPTNHV